MICRYLGCFLFLFLVFGASALAQDEDIQSAVDYKVEKMQKELKLTDSQADAIRPIIKDYLTKRGAVLQEVAGEGIVDHVAVKSALKLLKEKEYEQLGKILSEDQMKKWINKENLMATLNPDSVESTVDDGATMNGTGGGSQILILAQAKPVSVCKPGIREY